ncbi:MAG TPA: hypothetical protein PKD37_03300 [Oligoflexia bacterium]|nr:hypothetical protein [Oligoflexia bacterium]HMP26995.1 hypothetical protein [Oligoflexia bacterium]
MLRKRNHYCPKFSPLSLAVFPRLRAIISSAIFQRFFQFSSWVPSNGLIFPFLLAVVLFASVVSAFAQSENDFFEKNAARTIFDDSITENGLPHIKLLRPQKKDDQPKLSENLKLKSDGASEAEDSLARAKLGKFDLNGEPPFKQPASPLEVKQENPPQSVSQKLLSKYGDPNKDAPILADDKAPQPFKAMMEALDSGDEKLAFDYARQYVRHLRNLNQRTQRAVAMQALAMEKEGMLGVGGWQNDPMFNDDRKKFLGEDDFVRAKSIEALAGEPKKLSEQALDLIAGALSKEKKLSGIPSLKDDGASDDQLPSAGATLKDQILAEKEKRLKLRASFANRAPIDPKGKVTVLYFVRPNERNSQLMGRYLESIYRKYAGDKNVQIRAFTVEELDVLSAQAFRYGAGATYQLEGGSKLAERLNIRVTPSLVFMSASTGEAIVEEGARELVYIDELISFMSGR